METLSTGELPCFRCGLVAIPRTEAGTGPHHLKALCRGCGRFLKWLAKPKEDTVTATVNRVVLLGTIGKQGVEVRYSTNGTPCATFMLLLVEAAQDGKHYTTLVPCEIWGKRAEAAAECEAGQLVVFEGKIRKRAKGENQWELVVGGFELTPITAAVPVETA